MRSQEGSLHKWTLTFCLSRMRKFAQINCSGGRQKKKTNYADDKNLSTVRGGEQKLET